MKKTGGKSALNHVLRNQYVKSLVLKMKISLQLFSLELLILNFSKVYLDFDLLNVSSDTVTGLTHPVVNE